MIFRHIVSVKMAHITDYLLDNIDFADESPLTLVRIAKIVNAHFGAVSSSYVNIEPSVLKIHLMEG